MSGRIRRLEDQIDRLEQEIAAEAERIKRSYARASSLMPPDKSYYLNGIQTGSVVKAYLLTSIGVGVQGETTIPIADFIDSAMRFAGHQKRKVEVLAELEKHLEKIHLMLGFPQPS